MPRASASLILAAALVASACAAPLRAQPPAAPSNAYVYEGVEVFGLRTLPRDRILALIGLPPAGGRYLLDTGEFTPFLVESKARLLAAYPLPFCRYSLVAYPPRRTFRVTVDLVEPGDEWRMRFDPAPQGDPPDPDGLLAAWREYQRLYWKLRNAGAIPETPGPCRALQCHGGFAHPELAPLEQRFVDGVPRNADALVRVLREDRDDLDRMTALMLLPYLGARERLVEVVLPAVRDPFEGVRNEALRLLGAIQEHQPRVLVPLEPLLEALWFPLATDRNKAAWALVRILEAEGDARRAAILSRAGAVLVEMVGMGQATDAEPARRALTLLAGRDLGARPEDWRAWASGASTAPTTGPPASSP